MKIELEFAELHNPLFLNGTNLQMKLQPEKREGLYLIYDRDDKELHVYFKDRLAIVPHSNVSSMTPKKSDILGPLPKAQTQRVESKIRTVVNVNQDEQTKSTQDRIKVMKSAQVSGPTQHVFSNEPGKVRD